MLLFFGVCLLTIHTSWGQIEDIRLSERPTRNTNGRALGDITDTSARSAKDSTAGGDLPGGIIYHVDIPDSVLQGSVFGFHRLPLQVKLTDYTHPMLTPTGGQFCDRLDALNGQYYLTVTEIGHQHISLFPSFDRQLGLEYRKNVFPGFYKTPENILFYQVQNPYTLLSYNSSLNSDYQVHVTHTQNITERWNYALDYHLFSPKGVFANTSAVDHLVDITSNYYSTDARYQVSGGLIWQRMVVGENGGLSNESAFVNRSISAMISNMAGVPVNYNNRFSNTNDRTVFVKQSFNTVRQFEWYKPIVEKHIDTTVTRDTLHIGIPDSITGDTVWSDSVSVTESYALRDTIVGYDTIQPHTPMSFNTGVFAMDLQWDREKYRCRDSVIHHRLAATLYWTNDAYIDKKWHNPLKLYAGIRPQYSSITLDDSIYRSGQVEHATIYPFAQVAISPWPACELNVKAEASINLEEYNLDGRLVFPFRDSLGHSTRNLTLHATVKAYRPELIYYAQSLLSVNAYSGGLHSVGVRQIEADYQHNQSLRFYVSAQHIDHNIWFEQRTAGDGSTMIVPRQTNGSALLLQARLNAELKLTKWLHLDMQQHLQYSSDQELIPVPLFASKNSLYADFWLFSKALHTQVGVDLRYHTLFYADSYDPVLGVFYRQNDTEVGNYLWADVFVNLQVKRATIYVKAGHVNSFIDSQGYFMLPHYPCKQFGLYFGMTWKFFD